MAKLWGIYRKDKLKKDWLGQCTVKLSMLVPLRINQKDIEIKFYPVFDIKTSKSQITHSNIDSLLNLLNYNPSCIAFVNAKGSPFADGLILSILSSPCIGFQEKQGVIDKKRKSEGMPISLFRNSTFKTERAKFLKADVFILVTEADVGEITLGERDVISLELC